MSGGVFDPDVFIPSSGEPDSTVFDTGFEGGGVTPTETRRFAVNKPPTQFLILKPQQ